MRSLTYDSKTDGQLNIATLTIKSKAVRDEYDRIRSQYFSFVRTFVISFICISTSATGIQYITTQNVEKLAICLRLLFQIILFAFVVNNKRLRKCSPQTIVIPILLEAVLVNMSLRGHLPDSLTASLNTDRHMVDTILLLVSCMNRTTFVFTVCVLTPLFLIWMYFQAEVEASIYYS